MARRRRRKLKLSVKIFILVVIALTVAATYGYTLYKKAQSYEPPKGEIEEKKNDDEEKGGDIKPIGGDDDNKDEDIKNLTYKVYDLNGAEAILVKTDDRVALIDTGSKKSAKKLVSKVDEDTAGEIDYLILTADTKSRAGGMKAISKNFKVKKVLYGNFENKKEEKIRKYFKDSEILDTKETTFDLGSNGKITTYCPKARSEDPLDKCIITLVDYGSTSFYSASDSGVAEEKKMYDIMENRRLSVYVPSRHGDDKVNYLMNIISPAYTAVQLKKKAALTDAFIERCDSYSVYDTGKCGDLMFRTEGDTAELVNEDKYKEKGYNLKGSN